MTHSHQISLAEPEPIDLEGSQMHANVLTRQEADYKRLERFFRWSLAKAGPDGLTLTRDELEQLPPDFTREELPGGGVRFKSRAMGS